jgi:hypothetical protein
VIAPGDELLGQADRAAMSADVARKTKDLRSSGVFMSLYLRDAQNDNIYGTDSQVWTKRILSGVNIGRHGGPQ